MALDRGCLVAVVGDFDSPQLQHRYTHYIESSVAAI